MITDRIQLAGLDAYFRDPATGKVNLGGITPTIRTAPLKQGKQVEISGIQMIIEHQDLQPLLAYPSDNAGLPTNAPLFKISVMKEMFPGLFADPFSHRVHNIAGYLDFNEGTLINGRVMEVDGIPTVCSTGREECIWVSREYVMPDPISMDAIAWELATTKLTPPDSFHYKIEIALNGVAASIVIDNAGQMLKADAKRAIEGLSNVNINSFQITFTAKVFEDSYFSDRHLPAIDESIGRPLLRAINILEPVKSVYEIYSITELQSLCNGFRLFDTPGAAIQRLTAVVDLNAVLVSSVCEYIPVDGQGNKQIYDAAARYEYVEFKVYTNQFTLLEGRRIEEILIPAVETG